MYLDSAQEKLFRAEGGEARQLAMEILAKVGSVASVEGDAAREVLTG